MDLLCSFGSLKLTNLKPVREVNRNRSRLVLVLDLRLEDFDVDGSISFTEVCLKDPVTNLPLFSFLLVLCVGNVTTCSHLILVHLIHVTEELEDILTIERVSRSKVVAKGVLARWHKINLDVLAQMHVLH